MSKIQKVVKAKNLRYSSGLNLKLERWVIIWRRVKYGNNLTSVRFLNFTSVLFHYLLISRVTHYTYSPILRFWLVYSLRAGSRWSTSARGVAASAKSSCDAAGASSPDSFPPDRFALRRSRVWLKGEPACRLTCILYREISRQTLLWQFGVFRWGYVNTKTSRLLL